MQARLIGILSLLTAVLSGCSRVPSGMPETVAPGAALVEVFSEKFMFEGPTWDQATRKLYFTALGEETQIRRLDEPGKATVWMDRTEAIIGMYLANDGRLLGCQSQAKKIVSMKIGADGPEDFKVITADVTWNGPNDLVQLANGDIYFTDPDSEGKKSATYRIAADGNVAKVATESTLCNGIIASLDGKTLYIADSMERLWRSYKVNTDGTLSDAKVFFNPDVESKSEPDGGRIDELGNLYLTGRGGVWVVSPEGKALGLIAIKEFSSNVTFGGDDGKTLYVTCDGKLYSLQMKVRGAQIPGPSATPK